MTSPKRLDGPELVHLTRQQARTLAAVALAGDRSGAARLLGLSSSTVGVHLGLAFERLDVTSVSAAYRVLGWLDIPADLLDVEIPPAAMPLVWIGGL